MSRVKATLDKIKKVLCFSCLEEYPEQEMTKDYNYDQEKPIFLCDKCLDDYYKFMEVSKN